MSELSQLPNIGNILEDNLHKIGVKTTKDLTKLGSKEAFKMIKLHDQSACLNMLYALEGAVQGVRWHGLTLEEKKELKDYFQSLTKI